ncbi:SDR family oxidoreductase [Mycobacteroides franklinii]|uniref:3-alpha-(Or 20-beta)-hydroxysteroid dehydrogenase n=1 Tax=Mycobacteroides franklinii TaxID=948102 RepID=A0A1S1L605_9MYCO|nr:SDR family oxidoreductase [Mycobacteroides franklinii]OHU19186.1 short-chain dehydrogenase [Mycobacteroides franklinii]TDZ45162.1 3-alpha-(or 20-beta)-hydroxysteroid dehydrogenase [Mycobacteroides franklinii]TDZ48652.1 3-alpha-(or 20-beta)-hydroxysteroid dehydrogenase [Mycobacteroides franklinii]TDZ58833.1 3-alpha-(or 20-beta)-hydroxysteroid dehydrogenase [Mycobacteroides franklinii]TDZ66348.1 3-alpha-(or 20-beta)-hydroxysteroid dehydrogenase [Mycobacteroides franklinii]
MKNNSNVLRGRVIAITGGARGIGFATASTLRALGAKVAIGDVDEVAAKQSGADIDVFPRQLDVTDFSSFTTFLDDVEHELGPLDVLINNAGIMPVGLLTDEPDAVTRRILDINVYGVIIGTKLAAQRMVPRTSGHVINVASLAGETYTAGLATYCASKHAVVGFTDAVRVENRKTGVHFSTVLPSFVNTELTSGTTGIKGLKNAEPSDIADAIVDLIINPRPKVRVTRLAGALISSQKFMPRVIAEGFTTLFGGDHVFTDNVDTAQRKAYEDRARGER